MAYSKENWVDKEKRAEQAGKHTEEMERLYGERIKESVKNTILYDVDFQSTKTDFCETEIIVEATDSVSAVINHAGGNKNRMAVLNFSSYKNPGGMFIDGSQAQEESLCHESFLYNVLSEFERSFAIQDNKILTKWGFYCWNNKHKNKALYLNRGLYSPDIMFIRDGKCVLCDVITCAAPNKTTGRRYQNVSEEENTEVLKSRIQFVLDMAKENQVDTLILGAYGCGVFGQDAKEVANIFKGYLESTHKCFPKVIFAIPKGKDNNLEAFENIFRR